MGFYLDNNEDCHEFVESMTTFLYLLWALRLCNKASVESKAILKTLCHHILGMNLRVIFAWLRTPVSFSHEKLLTLAVLMWVWFGRTPIPPEKPILIYLWMLANGNKTSRQVADRLDATMGSCVRVLRKVNTTILSMIPRYHKWLNGETILFVFFC